MSPLWDLVLPGISFVAVAVGVRFARNLSFFSRRARDLDQIDIPNEVREIRINELEMLVCDEADARFKFAWSLTPWQRRAAVTRRMQEVRKWLRLIISNATLFQEVARFHLQDTCSDVGDCDPEEQPLLFKVMDRAASVRLIAGTCLLKLMIVDFYRVLWPTHVPALADRFQVRGQDLIVWYRHLVKEILELTAEYYDDVTYARFILQLTGLFTLEEAAALNRV